MHWEAGELRCVVCSDGHLFKRDAPGQQLDQISGLDDGIRVKRFLIGTHWDAALNQVQGGFDVLARWRVGGVGQQVTQEKEQKRTEMLHSAKQIQTDVLLLPRLSPPVASTPSGRLLCTWGRGWRSCFPPADHGHCPLEWTGAPSSHQGQSGGRSRPLRVQTTIRFNNTDDPPKQVPWPMMCENADSYARLCLGCGTVNKVHAADFYFLNCT